MLKRVLAWVLLVGFVLLMINIVFWHVFQVQSIALYAVIAVWFLFSDKTNMSRKSKISEEVIKRMNSVGNDEPDVSELSDTEPNGSEQAASEKTNSEQTDAGETGSEQTDSK